MEYLSLPARAEYAESADETMLRNEVFGKPPPVIARFYIDAVRDDDASTEAGYPVYIEKVFVHLQVSGERDSVTNNADDEQKYKFPKEWELFVRNSKHKQIPLDALPLMRPNIKKALNELGIRTLGELLEKDVPEFFAQWKKWAVHIKAIHDMAEGKPKPRLKLVAGEMVAA